MKQTTLLLWACRRAIAQGALLGVGIPLAFYLFYIFLFHEQDMGILAGFISPWLTRNAFTITVVAAAVAAFCQFGSGLYTTLSKLPVPVSTRQLAYIPLSFALLHWTLLMAACAALLFLSRDSLDDVNIQRALAATGAAIPLGLLLIVVINRNASNPDAQLWTVYPFYIYLLLLPFENHRTMPSLALAQAWYDTLLPGLLILSLLIIWESPRRHEAWRRAAFIPIPTGVGTRTIRESLAPQRLHWLSLSMDFVTFGLRRLGDLMAATFFLIVMQSIFFDTVRPPLWAEWLAFGCAGLYALSGMAYFVGKTLLLRLLNGTSRPDKAWTQPLLFVAHALERLSPTRRFLRERIIFRDPASGRYMLHTHSVAAGKSPLERSTGAKEIRPSQVISWAIAGQFMVIGTMSGLGERSVEYYREGSHIQGDTQHAPDEGYSAEDAFSQHYVAIDLGEDQDPNILDSAVRSIQTAVAETPDPASWLLGLKTSDGGTPTLPQKFRVEIARPYPHIVVIQSMGLHWDRAGHLAYALAKRLIDAGQLPVDATIDDDFAYHRALVFFTPLYGFLDNSVHWVEAESKGEDGQNYAPAPLPTDTPIYVDHRNSDGRQNGKSWATAYDTIQEGIDAAYRRRVAGVWVAAGTYDAEGYGDGPLYMRPGVHIYGGFRGDESIRTQRDTALNTTIIDGSHARDGKAAYHVVVAASPATLDGFTVTGGNADGSELWEDGGGGLLVEDCSPNIANCAFTRNTAKEDGGAVRIYNGKVTFDRCTFESNHAGSAGGAIDISLGEAVTRRCRFIGNYAGREGGAVAALGEEFSAENCLFAGNSNGERPGIIYSLYFTLKNCTVVGVESEPLFTESSDSISIINCILWGTDQDLFRSDVYIVNSIVPSGHPGPGNLSLNPLFRDAVEGDYRLMPGSPAIDAGTSEDAPRDDIDGVIRPQGGGVDIGAYEFANE